MFIVWGRKIKRYPVGYVADFCPICRTQKPFALLHVGAANHVYYVSLGSGELVGYERTCADCSIAIPTDIARYSNVASKLAPLSELKAQTFPNLDAVVKDLLVEEQINRAPPNLRAATRHALIKERFLLLSPKVEKRFGETHIGPAVGVALIVAILLIFVAAPRLIESELVNVRPDAVFGGFAALTIALVVWQVIASGSRFMRREIVPMLAKALKPLQPTEQEINAILAELMTLRQKIGKRVSAAELLERIRSAA